MSRYAMVLWLALFVFAPGDHQAKAQAVSERVVVDVRLGAKVNVRSTPDVTSNNVVGKALGGDFATVTETVQSGGYTWFRVVDENGGFEGWIRGDLIAETEPSQAAPLQASGETQEPTPAAVRLPVVPSVAIQTDEASPIRPGWVNSLMTHIEAVQSCVETGSAQPALASDLRLLQRGLIEVDVLDSADRQWKCVVRGEGGTPLRFDPMYSSGASDRSRGVFFASALTGRPQQEACHQIEQVSMTGGQEFAGWLIYTDCP